VVNVPNDGSALGNGVADTRVHADLLHDDVVAALLSWREEHVSELESESPAEWPKAHVDDELVDRARNLNELRAEGMISDREFAAERQEIRRALGLRADSEESLPEPPPR
jgi:hypothetical protein